MFASSAHLIDHCFIFMNIIHYIKIIDAFVVTSDWGEGVGTCNMLPELLYFNLVGKFLGISESGKRGGYASI